VQDRFRVLVRRAHPDHGGDTAAAAVRLAELAEARRILLAG
jgi:curved DNA-binding protein CbpA